MLNFFAFSDIKFLYAWEQELFIAGFAMGVAKNLENYFGA